MKNFIFTLFIVLLASPAFAGIKTDSSGRLVNSDGHRINFYGQLLNEENKPIDSNGNLIPAEGLYMCAAKHNQPATNAECAALTPQYEAEQAKKAADLAKENKAITDDAEAHGYPKKGSPADKHCMDIGERASQAAGYRNDGDSRAETLRWMNYLQDSVTQQETKRIIQVIYDAPTNGPFDTNSIMWEVYRQCLRDQMTDKNTPW
jgi:hypothetical protein